MSQGIARKADQFHSSGCYPQLYAWYPLADGWTDREQREMGRKMSGTFALTNVPRISLVEINRCKGAKYIAI